MMESSRRINFDNVSSDDIVNIFRNQLLRVQHYLPNSLRGWRRDEGGHFARLCHLLGFPGDVESNRQWLYIVIHTNRRGVADSLLHLAQEPPVRTPLERNEEDGTDLPDGSHALLQHTFLQAPVVLDDDHEGGIRLKRSWQDAILPAFSRQIPCALCIRRSRIDSRGVVSADYYYYY